MWYMTYGRSGAALYLYTDNPDIGSSLEWTGWWSVDV